MIPPDTHTLTGAYALDALDDHERASVERHLAECPVCADEVEQLRAVAALLGSAAAEPPPPSLRDAVLAGVEGTRQLPPRLPSRGRASRTRRLYAVAASVAAGVVLAAFGVVAVDQHDQLNQARRQAADLGAFASAIAATTSHPVAGGGTLAAAAAGDHVFVSARDLPALPGGRVYQLWLTGPTGIRSLGVVDGQSGGVDRLVTASPSEALAVKVTIEPAAGSAQPTTPVLASAPLRA
ncbi:MAG: anti-sigma factor [Frankia sp.]